jgi:hypothetical protein
MTWRPPRERCQDAQQAKGRGDDSARQVGHACKTLSAQRTPSVRILGIRQRQGRSADHSGQCRGRRSHTPTWYIAGSITRLSVRCTERRASSIFTREGIDHQCSERRASSICTREGIDHQCSDQESPKTRKYKLILKDPPHLLQHEPFHLAHILQHLLLVLLPPNLTLHPDLLE